MKSIFIRPALLYFLFYAAAGALIPFLNIFYQVKGLSMGQISILAALPMGMTLIAAPVWAGIADFFGLHRKILPLLMILTMPLMALIGLADSFIVLLPIVVLYGFCYSPITPLQDNSVLTFLSEKRHEYGKPRLWGSISWAVLGVTAGVLIGKFGPAIAYILYIVFMGLNAWVAFKMPDPVIEKGEPYWVSLRRVAGDNRWYGFLAGALLTGIAFAFENNYFFLFLKSLGAPSSIQGLAVFTSSVMEIPFFIYSAVLLKKYSARGLMQFSMLVLIVRLILTSLLKDPVWGIAVQLLHGVFFSTFWAGGVSLAHQIAPKGLSASAQALFGASFYGFGGIIGAILGGWLYGQFNPTIMFQAGAFSTFLGFLFITFWARPKHAPLQNKYVHHKFKKYE